MHDVCKGDIIINMDDDDYYPPERVEHAVSMLRQHPHALCAGSSEMYIYFRELQEIYRFGPYGKNHATAATFAFRKKLLNDTRYNDDACLAEEKEFLKDYTIPFVQLESKKTILVFSHEHNTFDKRRLLDNPDKRFVFKCEKEIEHFVKNDDILKFIKHDVGPELENYKIGLPIMKPDVLQQIKDITEERLKSKPSKLTDNKECKFRMKQEGKETVELNDDQVLELLQIQHKKINELTEQLNDAYDEIEKLRENN